MILLDGNPVTVEKFPNGEIRIPVNDFQEKPIHNMSLRYRDDQDLLTMMFVKSHLDSICERCHLHIEYLPYSRMDRCNPSFIFTLKPLCEMINRMNFEWVRLIEPHSDVAPALLNRCKSRTFSDALFKAVANREIVFDRMVDAVLFPDAGAQKRYISKFAGCRVAVGDKTRDFATGSIKEIKLSGATINPGSTVVIVDDLCSYGGTFVMAADALRMAGAGYVYLVVTHCEKSIFKGDLLKTGKVDKVFTTNILFDEEDIPENQGFSHRIKIMQPMEIF